MNQASVWIPTKAAIEQDHSEYNQYVQRRRIAITNDMNQHGYHYMIWDDWKQSGSSTEMGAWLKARDHMKCYITQAMLVCYAFKQPGDALMFKLTWVGV